MSPVCPCSPSPLISSHCFFVLVWGFFVSLCSLVNYYFTLTKHTFFTYVLCPSLPCGVPFFFFFSLTWLHLEAGSSFAFRTSLQIMTNHLPPLYYIYLQNRHFAFRFFPQKCNILAFLHICSRTSHLPLDSECDWSVCGWTSKYCWCSCHPGLAFVAVFWERLCLVFFFLSGSGWSCSAPFPSFLSAQMGAVCKLQPQVAAPPLPLPYLSWILSCSHGERQKKQSWLRSATK